MNNFRYVQALKIGSFDYYDNGKHWCRLCNVFPETVENLLKHYHSKEHHDQIQVRINCGQTFHLLCKSRVKIGVAESGDVFSAAL